MKAGDAVDCMLLLTPERKMRVRGTIVDVLADGHYAVEFPFHFGGTNRLKVHRTDMRHISLLQLIAEAAM